MKKCSVYMIFALIILCGLSSIGLSQQPNNPVTEAKKLRVIELAKQLEALEAQKTVLINERAELLREITRDEEAAAFKNRPSYIVTRIFSENAITLIKDGSEQNITLTGVQVIPEYKAAASAFLKEKLASGLAYVRCASSICFDAFIYSKLDEPSLNAQLVNKGFAKPIGIFWPASLHGELTSPPSTTETTTEIISPSHTEPSTSSPSTGGTVHVKGYYRKDGTYVRPHTRSAPRRKN